MCAGPLADIVDATRRMLELRRYRAWEEREVEWVAQRDPRLVPLLPRTACRDHPALFVAADEGVLVLVTDAPKISMASLKQLCDRETLIDHFGVRSVLLLTKHPITTQTQNILPAHISILPWVAVLTRPLDHEIVPAHRRATADDLRQMGVARAARALLPSLRASDPIVQYLGLRIGDVVRVDRLDGSVYLRVVTAH
jgi:DNA-directed RNA polymerase subunit H (RpoH/RPB5)